MVSRSVIAAAAFAAAVKATSLTVVNRCNEEVLLFTQTSFGSINNNVQIGAGGSANLGISSNWDGAVNVGKGYSMR